MASKAKKTQTLWCERGQHQWEREAKRGRRPLNCPTHQPEAELVEAVKPKLSQEERAERARAGKEAKRREREAEAEAKQREELQNLRETLPTLFEEYHTLIDEDEWAKAGNVQVRILGLRARQRALEGAR